MTCCAVACSVYHVQFLESYKSVTLDSMATAFDVGLPFLDSEISDLICAGRISAKIDKVRQYAVSHAVLFVWGNVKMGALFFTPWLLLV